MGFATIRESNELHNYGININYSIRSKTSSELGGGRAFFFRIVSLHILFFCLATVTLLVHFIWQMDPV